MQCAYLYSVVAELRIRIKKYFLYDIIMFLHDLDRLSYIEKSCLMLFVLLMSCRTLECTVGRCANTLKAFECDACLGEKFLPAHMLVMVQVGEFRNAAAPHLE
jgi:hypothetical protein